MQVLQSIMCDIHAFFPEFWMQRFQVLLASGPIDNPNWSLGASRSNHLWLPSTPSPSSISISTSLSTPRRIDIPIRSPGVQCTLCALVVITCSKKSPERVRASTSSCRVFANYFKTPHTDQFVFSQESRNQKWIKIYPILSPK